MKSKVALIDMKMHKNHSLAEGLRLLGGISKLNKPERDVILKVGRYSGDSYHHTTIEVTHQIIDAFDQATTIYLTESDSYNGTGLERLQKWKRLFSDRVIPYNLSEEKDTKSIKINTDVRDLSIDLSSKLFKPSVFVTTHVLRTYTKGSVLKNLFGLTPTKKKAQYHKNEIFYQLLTDMTEAIGGIDLAVLDGSFLHTGPGARIRVKTDLLVVGMDAVAVETVGAKLVGHDPEKLETIQSFARLGLGIGSFDDIEILGDSFESLRERVAHSIIKAKELSKELPQPWSASGSLTELMNRGYFQLPNKRSIDDVAIKMEQDDSRAKGRRSMIYSTLRRRVKSGRLRGEKESKGWIFWTEN